MQLKQAKRQVGGGCRCRVQVEGAGGVKVQEEQVKRQGRSGGQRRSGSECQNVSRVFGGWTLDGERRVLGRQCRLSASAGEAGQALGGWREFRWWCGCCNGELVWRGCIGAKPRLFHA
eukprot:1137439-Pelagomonas_calceolata.AAC.7